MTQARIPRMALDVRLVDDVQTDFVAQIEESRVVGIVGATHRIHVVLFHQHEVGTHVVRRHGLPALRMVVMAIDTPEHDPFAVHQEISVNDLHPSESRSLFDRLAHGSVGTDKRDEHRVQMGRLCRPRFDTRQNTLRQREVATEDVRPHITGHRRLQRLAGLSRSVIHCDTHRPSRRNGRAVIAGHRGGDTQRAR